MSRIHVLGVITSWVVGWMIKSISKDHTTFTLKGQGVRNKNNYAIQQLRRNESSTTPMFSWEVSQFKFIHCGSVYSALFGYSTSDFCYFLILITNSTCSHTCGDELEWLELAEWLVFCSYWFSIFGVALLLPLLPEPERNL